MEMTIPRMIPATPPRLLANEIHNECFLSAPSPKPTTKRESFDLEMREISMEEQRALDELRRMGKEIDDVQQLLKFLRETRSSNKKSALESWKTEILRGWLFANKMEPYPSVDEKRELMKAAGLTHQQLRNWFSNFRKRQFFPALNEKKPLTRNAIQKMYSRKKLELSPTKKRQRCGRLDLSKTLGDDSPRDHHVLDFDFFAHLDCTRTGQLFSNINFSLDSNLDFVRYLVD